MKNNNSLLWILLSLSFFINGTVFGANRSGNQPCHIEAKEVLEPYNAIKDKSFRSDRKKVKLIKHEIREKLNKAKTNRSDLDPIILIILAIFLPPLAVYFVDDISDPFWIDVVLTVLLWIPGVIYALYRVLKSQGKI